jgi:hypothetical protein
MGDREFWALIYGDSAVRCSDLVRQAIADGFGNRGWIAIRLSDGGSDGYIYEAREDAVRYQLHPEQCAYVKIPHDDMPPKAAHAFMRFCRQLYDAGYRMTDPEQARYAPIIPRRGY